MITKKHNSTLWTDIFAKDESLDELLVLLKVDNEPDISQVISGNINPQKSKNTLKHPPKSTRLTGETFVNQKFAEYGTLMAAAREILRSIAREQNKEIGVVNEEHRAMHDAYNQKQKNVDAVIKSFESKLDEELSYEEKLTAQKEAMAEIEYLNEEFELNWGSDLDVHEEKIAKINAHYEHMYQKTMKEAGYNLDADID